MLRIIFAGTPEFAAPCLRALIESPHKVIAVYTQPDRRAGRGRKLTPSPIKNIATDHHIPVFQPETLRDKAEQEILKALHADLMIVVAYGLILPTAVLEAPRLGCVNVHASLLPRWRGAAPISRAILAGDKQSGISIMQMEAGLDTGPVLNRITCPINSTDNAIHLHDRLAQLGADALLMAVSELEMGRAKPQRQDDSKATYAAKLSKEDGLIDWTQSAEQIERTIRAFNPWPVTYSHINNEVIRIYRAEIVENSSKHTPGSILECDKNILVIATGRGSLRLLEIQLPGGRVLPVADVLNARRNFFIKESILNA